MTRLPVDRNQYTLIHTNLCYLFTVIFLVHFYISVFIIRYPWRRTLSNVVKGRTSSWTWVKLTQRTSAWLLLIGGGVLIITGFALLTMHHRRRVGVLLGWLRSIFRWLLRILIVVL